MKKNGFTLTEVLVTVIVVGTIAALALPNLSFVVEKTKAGEGYQILTTLLHQQESYRLENPSAPAPGYATALIQLDVTFATIANFTISEVNNNTGWLACLDRNTGGYALYIDNGGKIYCTDTCASKLETPAICVRLGCNRGGGDECN